MREPVDQAQAVSLDDLRERLYRAHATAGDVERYRAAVARAAEPTGPAADVAAAPVPSRRSRARWVVLGIAPVVAGLVVAGAVGVVGAPRPDPPASPLLPVVQVDPPDRRAFVSALDAGRRVGLGAWFRREPDRLPAALRRGVVSVSEEFTGSGTRMLTLEPPATEQAVGTGATVVLVAARDATAGWSAFHLEIHDDRTVHLARNAVRRGAVRAGAPTYAGFVHGARDRPVRLRVEAPRGVRWSVTVAFTADGLTAAARPTRGRAASRT